MHYADLIQLYFERCNALQWYWTLYVVVIGGLLAFSSLRVRRDFITAVLVTVLFCFFSYKNQDAIKDTMTQRHAAYQAIQQYITPSSEDSNSEKARAILQPTLVDPDIHAVARFHRLSALLTVLAIWAMELRRIRMARNEQAK